MKQSDIDKAQYKNLFELSPFIDLLNIQVDEVDAANGRLTLTMPFSEKLSRAKGSGQFHGGAIAALIDTAGAVALAIKVSGSAPTINFRTDYFRPATNCDLTATAVIRRVGTSVSVVDVDVSNNKGECIAVGRGTFGSNVG